MDRNDLLEKVYETLSCIKETNQNSELLASAKKKIEDKQLVDALDDLKKLKEMGYELIDEKTSANKLNTKKEVNESNDITIDTNINYEESKKDDEEEEISYTTDFNKNDQIDYPPKLADFSIEEKYIAALLNNLKAISVYYFTYEECQFINPELLNIYKIIIFTDADKYAPEVAKEKFRLPNKTLASDIIKRQLKRKYQDQKESIEKIYTDLKKQFLLRKSYKSIPVKNTQDEIAEIMDYELYDQMSIEEVKSAIEQVTTTEKFKRAILNQDITEFLVQGNNSLTNGLELPFSVLSSVFKGVRKGETMAFAMPSNSGKSRFTMNMAAYIALVHKKKVLVISNEMSEDKMKLCLITTIINNPKIQELHGQKLRKTEGELLEFKYRADEGKNVKVDKDGFVLQEENESHSDFVKRLLKVSKEFKMTTAVTDWFNKQTENYMYFINITDHTNDELKKVIMNYYYKEHVEYVFYDTLKTDIDNIGVGYEIKKTATILANLAQNFGMYIASTIQLSETETDPINLNVNDLAVSRTVKEVLDTLCLFKQIHNEDLGKYEYSLNEVDNKFFDLEKFANPDVRYYTCVVDKNRAGSKPKLLFRLNLAYNEWIELGYIRLK